jgi:hypothetical protein
MKRAHAARLITATEVMSPMGDKSAFTSERQAPELSRGEPSRRKEVVQRAVEATGVKLTAAAIRAQGGVKKGTPS